MWQAPHKEEQRSQGGKRAANYRSYFRDSTLGANGINDRITGFGLLLEEFYVSSTTAACFLRVVPPESKALDLGHPNRDWSKQTVCQYANDPCTLRRDSYRRVSIPRSKRSRKWTDKWNQMLVHGYPP